MAIPPNAQILKIEVMKILSLGLNQSLLKFTIELFKKN